MSKNNEKRVFALGYWASFIKFNVVGLSGVLVNEGLLILLTMAGVYYLYSSLIAIEVSILSNFFLNDSWTFKDRRTGSMTIRLVKFNALMVVGLAANLVIVYVATTYFGIHYAISNLFGIAVAFFIRYALSVKYTWLREKEEKKIEDTPLVVGSAPSRRSRPLLLPAALERSDKV